MGMKKISKEILRICKSKKNPYKESKDKLVNYFHQLQKIEFENEEELTVLISLHRELSTIKNRKASFLEEEIARLILVNLPFRINMMDTDIPVDTIEKLKENYDSSHRTGLKMSSKLLKYGKEVVASKDDRSKRYKKRVKEIIRMLNELQRFYKIKGIKKVFESKIEDKDKDLQFFALYGLEVYFAFSDDDDLTEEESQRLERIINMTKNRDTASTCCQILINAGKISQFGAISRIDEWKDKNWS